MRTNRLAPDTDEKAVGPKALSPIRLNRMGLTVPAGFWIPVEAYREHIERNGVLPRIAAALDTLASAPSEQKMSILSGIREAIIEAGLDPWRWAAQAQPVAPVRQVLLSGATWDTVRERLSATERGHAFLRSWDQFRACHENYSDRPETPGRRESRRRYNTPVRTVKRSRLRSSFVRSSAFRRVKLLGSASRIQRRRGFGPA